MKLLAARVEGRLLRHFATTEVRAISVLSGQAEVPAVALSEQSQLIVRKASAAIQALRHGQIASGAAGTSVDR